MNAPDRPDDTALERAVRASLAADAARLRPTDRLGSILGAARDSSSGRASVMAAGADEPGDGGPGPRPVAGSTAAESPRPARRWWPVTAAAAVALLAAAVVWLNLPGRSPVPVPAVTTSSATSSATAPAPTGSADATGSAPPTVAAPTATGTAPGTSTGATPAAPAPSDPTGAVAGRAVPIYRVIVVDSIETGRWAATREFVRVEGPQPSSGESVAQALGLALAPQTDPGSVTTWQPDQVGEVSVSADEVRVTLAAALDEPDADRARVAVQALVLTVQATLQRSDVPVVFTVADGSAEVATGVPAGTPVARVADLETSGVAAPVWLDQPVRGAVGTVGQPLVVSGRARVFEATVSWAVGDANGQVVAQGYATATVGAPQRGDFRNSWTPTEPGTYVLSVFEQSAQDGTPRGLVTRTVTVR